MTWAPCPHGVRTRGKKNSFNDDLGTMPTWRPYLWKKKTGNWAQGTGAGNWGQQTEDRELGTGNWGQGTGGRELRQGTGGRELGGRELGAAD